MALVFQKLNMRPRNHLVPTVSLLSAQVM